MAGAAARRAERRPVLRPVVPANTPAPTGRGVRRRGCRCTRCSKSAAWGAGSGPPGAMRLALPAFVAAPATKGGSRVLASCGEACLMQPLQRPAAARATPGGPGRVTPGGVSAASPNPTRSKAAPPVQPPCGPLPGAPVFTACIDSALGDAATPGRRSPRALGPVFSRSMHRDATKKAKKDRQEHLRRASGAASPWSMHAATTAGGSGWRQRMAAARDGRRRGPARRQGRAAASLPFGSPSSISVLEPHRTIDPAPTRTSRWRLSRWPLTIVALGA